VCADNLYKADSATNDNALDPADRNNRRFTICAPRIQLTSHLVVDQSTTTARSRAVMRTPVPGGGISPDGSDGGFLRRWSGQETNQDWVDAFRVFVVR